MVVLVAVDVLDHDLIAPGPAATDERARRRRDRRRVRRPTWCSIACRSTSSRRRGRGAAGSVGLGQEHAAAGDRRVCCSRSRARCDSTVATSPPRRCTARAIGLVFQDDQLFPHRDVAGNVEFGLRMTMRGRTRRDERATRVQRGAAARRPAGFEIALGHPPQRWRGQAGGTRPIAGARPAGAAARRAAHRPRPTSCTTGWPTTWRVCCGPPARQR